MIPEIVKSSANMLDEWSKMVLSGSPEIKVQKEFNDLTIDVISRTAFGSSFATGKHICDMQTKQKILALESYKNVYIPGFRFLPTKKNRQRWNFEKEIRKCVRQVVDAREKADSYGAHLLGFMTFDECKAFYFAGHETTEVLLTWTMILLGINQEWQERGRREVLEVCGKNNHPDADSLSRLKIVGMIINEALRLYPPAMLIVRQASEAMKLGRTSVPEAINILAIHHDPALWGSDANDFNPGRFSEGVAKAAKHPMAFMPFIARVGQNLALLEAKLVVAMILQKFTLVTSSSYTHAPVSSVTLRPQYGAQVIFTID